MDEKCCDSETIIVFTTIAEDSTLNVSDKFRTNFCTICLILWHILNRIIICKKTSFCLTYPTDTTNLLRIAQTVHVFDCRCPSLSNRIFCLAVEDDNSFPFLSTWLAAKEFGRRKMSNRLSHFWLVFSVGSFTVIGCRSLFTPFACVVSGRTIEYYLLFRGMES